jgi:class 3 adenylate cyclase
VYSQKTIAFMVNGTPMPETQTLKIRLTKDHFEVPLPAIRPGEFQLGHKSMQSDFFYALQPGKLVLEFEQASAANATLVVWGADAEMAGPTPDVQFTPCLTAKRLFTNQTFHDLFRSEVFQESEGFGVKDVTILFTDLKGSTQLYNRIGDLNAFALVREHYGVLSKAILDQHGAVVKTIGDAIMATFTQPQYALEAGLEMLRELHQLNKTSQYGDLVLKIGIHKGAAISVNLNERIDYFGQTVNIASRVQGIAGGDEIYLTDDIYASAGVPELLQKFHSNVEPLQIELKGIEGAVKVYKVTGSG